MFNDKIYSEKMNKTFEVFIKELSSLRTGRANASMLDLVKVDVYGQKMPINQLGTITTPEASHECTICLQNTNILTSKILRCGHKFHSSCIKEWFKEDNIKKRCPLCRSNNEGKDNESDNNDNDPLRDAITRLREDFSDERNRILSRHK